MQEGQSPEILTDQTAYLYKRSCQTSLPATLSCITQCAFEKSLQIQYQFEYKDGWQIWPESQPVLDTSEPALLPEHKEQSRLNQTWVYNARTFCVL